MDTMYPASKKHGRKTQRVPLAERKHPQKKTTPKAAKKQQKNLLDFGKTPFPRGFLL